jgi:hypothetical protein
MGDKLREEMEVFSAFKCTHLYKSPFKIVGPLSKMKTCIMKGPDIGKNTRQL